MLFYPNLPKVVGSDWLEARVRSIHGPHGSETACHVFGHTHFCLEEVTMTKKIFALVMVISVLGVFLGGCGSKSDDSGSSTSAPATGSTAGGDTTGK
jgi:hypothetical protein